MITRPSPILHWDCIPYQITNSTRSDVLKEMLGYLGIWSSVSWSLHSLWLKIQYKFHGTQMSLLWKAPTYSTIFPYCEPYRCPEHQYQITNLQRRDETWLTRGNVPLELLRDLQKYLKWKRPSHSWNKTKYLKEGICKPNPISGSLKRGSGIAMTDLDLHPCSQDATMVTVSHVVWGNKCHTEARLLAQTCTVWLLLPVITSNLVEHYLLEISSPGLILGKGSPHPLKVKSCSQWQDKEAESSTWNHQGEHPWNQREGSGVE